MVAALALEALKGGEGAVELAVEVGFVAGIALGDGGVGQGGAFEGGLGVAGGFGGDVGMVAVELVVGHAEADVVAAVAAGEDAVGIESLAKGVGIAGGEGALDGGGVGGEGLDEAGAAFVGGDGAIAGLGDGTALGTGEAPQAPDAGGDGADELDLEGVGGGEALVKGVEEGRERGGVLVALEGGGDDGGGQEPVLEGIHGALGFAFGGTGTSATRTCAPRGSGCAGCAR